jgi:putative transposase
MNGPEKPGWHNRGYLPHFDANGLMQHIVVNATDQIDFTQPQLAQLIETTLTHYDKARYCLHAWCIMPDHIHILVVFAPNQLLGRNVLEWKSWITTRWQKANNTKMLIFKPDYFDRYARTLEQSVHAVGYIESNPVAAGLVLDAQDWRWSSAWHKARGWESGKDWLPVFLPYGSR